MSALHAFKFGELPIDIIDGDRGKNYPKKTEFQLEGVPFLNSAAIKDGRIDFDLSNYITNEKYSLIKKGRVYKNDIIFTTRGNGVGKTAIFDTTSVYQEALINAQLIVVRSSPGKMDSDYLFYLIRSPSFQSLVAKFSSGSAQPQLPMRDLKDIPVSVLEYVDQVPVGKVLRTYDNLIENNNRRIAILEEMAQSLYREWFVKFRFPGHENCQFKDSPLGQIPEGWEVNTLKYVCNLTMGQSPKSEFYNENREGLPFFQGVKDFGLRFPVERVWCSKPTRFAQKDDILFSVRAPVGRLNIAGFDMCIGRGLCAINHKEGFQSFLYQQLKSIFTSDDMMGNGAIFNSVTKSDMEGVVLLCPSFTAIEKAENQLKPIFRNLDLLCAKIENLKIQRDMLLPKLISGKVEL